MVAYAGVRFRQGEFRVAVEWCMRVVHEADPAEHLGQRRDAFGTAYEQSAQLLERHLRDATRGAGNTRHIVIVENNDDVVRRQARVELDAVGAGLKRRAKCSQSVLRRARGSASMSDHAHVREPFQKERENSVRM